MKCLITVFKSMFLRTAAVKLFTVMIVALTSSSAHAILYDFESDSLPSNFIVENPNNYPGLIGTTTSLFHDGQKSLEISSQYDTSQTGKGVTIPLSGNSGHISWWQYDAYGSYSPIYMGAHVATDNADNYFDIQLSDLGWGGERSGNIQINVNNVAKVGPVRIAGSWTKFDLYISDSILSYYINDILIDTSVFVGNLVSLHFGIIGYSGGGYWIDSVVIENVMQSININVNGSGAGNVNIMPLNTVVNTSSTIKIPSKTQLTLSASPSEFSIFSGWSGDCTGKVDCVLYLDTDKTVSATFDEKINDSVTINLPIIGHYSRITDAYLASASGSYIKAWEMDFSENINFNQNKHIDFTGGCNSDFSKCSEYTTVHGNITIQKGSVAINNIIIQGNAFNSPPVANAGPNQLLTSGSNVVLDGSKSSDLDGNLITYKWSFASRPDGSIAELSNAGVANPFFVADIVGKYILNLIVNDGKLDSTVSSVSIVAVKLNSVPIANAGSDQKVTTESIVTLDGSASNDADGETLTYSWTFTSKPNGSSADLSNPIIEKPTFTADVAGTYLLNLVVSDGKDYSSAASVTVTATDPMRLNVGYTARNGLTVTLNSFSIVDTGGYYFYTANYTQKNNTAVPIDEGQLKLYFSNSSAQPQYGYFNKLYPGDTQSRSYTFKGLYTETPWILEFDHDNFFSSSPIAGSLQWELPINN